MLIFNRKSAESPDYSYTYSDTKIIVKQEKKPQQNHFYCGLSVVPPENEYHF